MVNLISLLGLSVLIGILASIPLGPIGVLCVQRTVNYGRPAGFASGYGAALADTIFATIAAWGLSYIINYIERDPIHAYRHRDKVKRKLWQDVVYTMLLTLTNPLAIFIFLALMAAFGVVVDHAHPYELIMVVIGVNLGATLWWFGLTYGVSHIRSLFRLRRLWWFNKISGIVIALFGAVAIVHGAFALLFPAA